MLIPVIELELDQSEEALLKQLTSARSHLPTEEMRVAIQVVLPAAMVPRLLSAVRQAALGGHNECSKDPYLFRREGEYVAINFGGRRFSLQATHGLRHLAELLRHPHEEIPALSLAALLDAKTEGERHPQADRVWDSALSTAQSGLPALDAKTPQLYRRRLEALETDAARARILGDAPALKRCANERTAILKALAAGLDHKGRPRLTHDGAERARQNVQKAIKAAIQKIAAEDPALGEHLRSSVGTGTQCRYRPVSPIPWMFS